MNQSPITAETIREFDRLLRRWMSAKAETDRRLREAERWWRLRNTGEEARYYASARGEGHHSASAWLHNVIVNKHADAVEAYPEPHILPREEDDTAQAEALSRILPCLLEQNRFEKTWSDVAWQKLKTGTGVYKVVWDSERLRGLGDIAIRFGYYRYEDEIMLITVIILVLLVQVMQEVGMRIASSSDRRKN